MAQLKRATQLIHLKYLKNQFSVHWSDCETAEIEGDSQKGRVGVVNNENNIGLRASFLGSQQEIICINGVQSIPRDVLQI